MGRSITATPEGRGHFAYFIAAWAMPAWSLSASDLSVNSQENVSSVRPKCPKAAVLR